MHRFTTNETKNLDKRSKIKLMYLICPLLIIFFIYLVSTVDSSTVDRQKESLERALNRDVIHCYAVEGFYPPSLDYLKKHYGLTYDESLFAVDYQPIASNMRPEITIILRQ